MLRPRGEERADEVSAVDDAISAVLPDGLRIAAAVHHVMVALGASGR